MTAVIGNDGVGRLNSISHDGPGGNLQNFNYTLDENGNRIAVNGSGGAESYTLDPLNRLTQAAYANGTTAQYSYDANGNRLSETTTNLSGTTVLTSTYDAAGQLLANGVMTYTHDANGNLLTAGADSYSWDWANRLANATVGGNTASYTYDALNLRVAETVNGQAANLLWNPLTRYPTLVDDGQANYLHGAGLLAQFPSGGGSETLLTDALGSVRGIADGSGALIGNTHYDVFGAIVAQSGVASNFGFTGERFTPEVELLHLRARDLQVGLGRFLSADTVQPNAPGSQGFNLYAYVANNPTTWIDPSGHIADTMPLPADLFKITLESIWPKIVAFNFFARLSAVQKKNLKLVAVGGLAFAGLILGCIAHGPCRQQLTTTMRFFRDFGSDCFCGVTEWLREHLPNSPFSYPELPGLPGAGPGNNFPDHSLPDWVRNLPIWDTPATSPMPPLPGFGGGGSPGSSPSGGAGGGNGGGPDTGAGGGGGNSPVDDLVRELNKGRWEFPLLDPLEWTPRLGDILDELPDFLDNIFTAKAERRPWQITKKRTARVMQHQKFGKFYKSKTDGLWWSKDTAGHGGSVWKVFEETGKGLQWIFDADEYGTKIKDKHKGDTGIFVPWRELFGAGF